MMVTCPLCNGEKTKHLFHSRDRVHHIPGVFTIYQCAQCEAVFIQPWLKDAEISLYYPEHYGRYRYSRTLEKKDHSGLRRFVRENYFGYPWSQDGSPSWLKKSAAFLLSFVMAKGAIPYRGDGRFLDVGCGAGFYLYRLKQWGWNVYGVEPSERGFKQAKKLGLDVRHGELRNARFPEDFFDVIRLNHVLEHLTDPRGTFYEIQRILKPDGVVYVTVPNTRSVNFWIFGENWYGLDSPRHVISYCPKTLRYLCNVTGLEIVRIQFRPGAFNFVRSLQYYLEEQENRWPRWLRRIDWPRNKLVRRALKPFFFLIDIARSGDVMTVTLRRTAR
jgi:SAM-dependent methyltransferase